MKEWTAHPQGEQGHSLKGCWCGHWHDELLCACGDGHARQWWGDFTITAVHRCDDYERLVKVDGAWELHVNDEYVVIIKFCPECGVRL